MSNTLQTDLIKKATRIVMSIKNFEVVLDPVGSTNNYTGILTEGMNHFDIADANQIHISEEVAQDIIYSYNILLTKGIIKQNLESSKKFKELEIELENEKRKRYRLEGQLEEWRRKYEGNDTFEGDITEDESP